MSHVHEGPLATYSSLTDKNLAGYFANTRMRKHLRKSGLINRRGELVSENQYRINMARKEHKKHVKNLLAQAIVHKSLDLERTRQVEIRRKLEEIAKIELVRRVRASEKRRNDSDLMPLLTHRRLPSPPPPPTPPPPPEKEEEIASRGRKGDEEILPYLSPRDSRATSRPTTAGEVRYRPQSAPGREPPPYHEDINVVYVDEHGRRISPDRQEQRPQKGRPEEIDTKHLYSLDTASLKKYALQLSRIEQGEMSPYLQSPLPTPPRSARGSRAGATGTRMRVRPRTADARSPYRERPDSGQVQSVSGSSKSSVCNTSPKSTPKSTPRRRAQQQQQRFVEGTLMLHRQEPAMMHQGEVQTLCEITMKYHGPNLTLPRDQRDPTQAISIDQQHCGGNTLTVFKENLQPGDSFSFISRRHRGFPFSLSIFMEGRIDCRISTCCEYRHAKGVKLGGKMGHFSLLKVHGATPCYKCKLNAQASPRSLKRPPLSKKGKKPEQMHEEVIVVDKKAVRDIQDEEEEEQNVEIQVEDDLEKDKVKHDSYIEPENDIDLERKNVDKTNPEVTDVRAKRENVSPKKKTLVIKVAKSTETEKYESDFEEDEDSKQKENDSADQDTSPRAKYEEEKFESSSSSSSSSSDSEAEEVDRNSVTHVVYDGKKDERKIIGLKEDEHLEEKGDAERNKVVVKDTDSVSDVNIQGRKISGYSDDEEYPDGPKYDTPESYNMSTKVTTEKSQNNEKTRETHLSRSSSSSSSSSERAPSPAKRRSSSSSEERVIKVPSPPTEKRKSPSPELKTRKSPSPELKQRKSSSSSSDENEKKHRKSPLSFSSSSEDEKVIEKKAEIIAASPSPALKRMSPIVMEQQRRKSSLSSQSSTSSVHISEPEEEVKKPSPPTSPPKSPPRSPPKSPPRSPPKSPPQSPPKSPPKSPPLRESSSSSESESEDEKKEEKVIYARQPSPDKLVEPPKREDIPERPVSPFPMKGFAYTSYTESLALSSAREEAIREVREEAQRSTAVHETKDVAKTVEKVSSTSSSSSSSSESESDNEAKKVQEQREEVRSMDTSEQKTIPIVEETKKSSSSSSSSSESESEHEGKKETVQEKEEVKPPSPVKEEKKKESSSSGSSSDSSSDSESGSDTDRKPVTKTDTKEATIISKDVVEEKQTVPPTSSPTPAVAKEDKPQASSSSSSSSSSDSSSSESETEQNKSKAEVKSSSPPPPVLPENTKDPPHVVKPEDVKDVKKPESSGSEDSSSDSSSDSSDSSSEDEDDKPKTESKENQGSKKEEQRKKMSESESDNKNTTIFASESDADNMYGGNDPDDILGSGTSYLRSIGVKAAVEYEGSILSLLEGKDDVDLNGIVMKSGQFQDLCKHIQKSDNLKTISVRNGQMTDDQFTQFADSLIKSSSKPVMLNLSLNKLGDNSAEKIVEMMTDKPSINILILHGNPMKDNGIKTLMDGLLDLHYAHIPDQEDTMSSSPEFCELKELDLGHTKMTNVGVEHVGRLLAANTSLKSLYMMGNKDITYTGWKTLGKALSQNTTLENLSLDFNNMRDVGIAALVTGLKDNQSVKQLDLEGSGLSDEGGKKLVELLKCNTTILDITLSPGNNISEKIQDDIRNYLGLNRAAANTKTF